MHVDVDDWLFGFLERHSQRYRPFDWPVLTTPEGVLFMEVWSRAFRQNSVAEAEADEATISLYETPPKYRQDHLPAILRGVRRARDERANQLRVHVPEPETPAEDRFVWPAEVHRGDILGLMRFLTGQQGNIRRLG